MFIHSLHSVARFLRFFQNANVFIYLNTDEAILCFLPTDGSWSCEKPKVLKLGVLPVKAMLAVEEHLWASSGGQVFIISTHTHCVEVGKLR